MGQLDKMLLARGLAYADAHHARLGVNYKQIPVNEPTVPVRMAYTLRRDDGWSQPGKSVRDVFDDDQHRRPVSNVVGHVLKGVHEPVLSRVLDYRKDVDRDVGAEVEKPVRACDAQRYR